MEHSQTKSLDWVHLELKQNKKAEGKIFLELKFGLCSVCSHKAKTQFMWKDRRLFSFPSGMENCGCSGAGSMGGAAGGWEHQQMGLKERV